MTFVGTSLYSLMVKQHIHTRETTKTTNSGFFPQHSKTDIEDSVTRTDADADTVAAVDIYSIDVVNEDEESKFKEKDIQLVMFRLLCSRSNAMAALTRNDGDLLRSVFELTSWDD